TKFASGEAAPEGKSRAASPMERALDTASSASRARRRARQSSNPFAIETVQVATEASTSPIITARTTASALRNMPHGERSGGRASATGDVPADASSTISCAAAEKIQKKAD